MARKVGESAAPDKSAERLLPPDVGTRLLSRKKIPGAYRYALSLLPVSDRDRENAARQQHEAAIQDILRINTTALDKSVTLEEARSAINKAKDAVRTGMQPLHCPELFEVWRGI